MPARRSAPADEPIVAYLDHAAATPLLAEALEAMLAHLDGHFANPSGAHRAGRAERRALDDARDSLAEALGAEPDELVFTSGGTESDNLAIFGVARGRPGRVVVSSIEHHGVLHPAETLGAELAPVGRDGVIDLDALEALVDPTVGLVSVMAVNNEVGTVQPLSSIASLVHRRAPEALLHCDAVQAMTWCDLAELVADFDLVSISGHKFGAPKGVGVLVVRHRAVGSVSPLILGGAEERELRPGTENVAGVLAMAAAARATVAARPETIGRVRLLRDRFVDGVVAAIPVVVETAPRPDRIVANAHLRFPGIVNEEFLIVLDELGVAASAGSACASGAIEPSHVLLAMGLSPEMARQSIRFSLGANTTPAEIDHAVDAVATAYRRLVDDAAVGR